MIRPYTGLEAITGRVIRCAIEVHRVLGPGLLESVYHECLLAELTEDGLTVQSALNLPITYKNRRLISRLEVDLMVERQVIVELKSVESLLPVHEAPSFFPSPVNPRKLSAWRSSRASAN